MRREENDGKKKGKKRVWDRKTEKGKREDGNKTGKEELREKTTKRGCEKEMRE